MFAVSFATPGCKRHVYDVFGREHYDGRNAYKPLLVEGGGGMAREGNDERESVSSGAAETRLSSLFL